MYIGKKIRELRKAQKMTLVELSEKSGVQLATLSRIENNRMVGTVESHIRIAEALGTDITYFYKGMSKSADRVDVGSSSSITEIFEHSDKSSYEMLTKNVLDKKMLPVLIKIETGGRTNTEENRPGTEKFLYVLDGQVKVMIGTQEYGLKPGHTLYFDASMPHYFVNNGKKTLKAVSVTTPVAL
jgi:transcriptional regulator with XRE-family HTH domain